MAAVVALLLPGLVMAAPTAGACGHCDRGAPCPRTESVEPAPETDSCCGSEKETPPAPSFGSADCDCGREAPPAVTADTAPRLETAAAAAPHTMVAAPASVPDATAASSAGEPAAPPAPLVFLIDCAFLI
jgi:hypothetical protein